MTTANQFAVLAARLERSLCGQTTMERYALGCTLLRLLAEGQPVSPQRLAEASGQAPTAVMAALRQAPSIEWDAHGNIVGAGLTLRPTPHRFEVDGRTLYTWCALDTLMFPILLGQTAHIESPCRGTGRPVRVIVTPTGVAQVEPPEAVVSLVAPDAHPDIRQVFCNDVHFFTSPAAAAAWLTDHPGAAIVPVVEAYHLGRRLADVMCEARQP
jgi:alkylmercury lyase